MKNKILKCFFTTLIVLILIASCAPYKVDDQTLMLFARAHKTYSKGMLKETVELLLPKNTKAKVQKFIPVLIMRGKAEYFLGNISDAEKTFRKAQKLNSAQVEAQLYLARIFREKGKFSEAKKIVDKLLENDQNNIEALRLAAEFVKSDDGSNNVKSFAYLDRAAAISKDNAFVFLDRAREYWIQGKSTEALNDINIAKILVSEKDGMYKTLRNLEKTILEQKTLGGNDVQ
ncbi:MAG: hypothetical protein Ta2B_05160 [Termitinemataceae bacterium]|nr:MAG: hypothetical protein Ta2B_05160 [Termitinemataceae bacterium]